MSSASYYFWLATQGFVFAFLFPPVAILTVVGVVGTALLLPSALPNRWRQVVIAILVPMVLPAAILLCGVLLVHDTESDIVAPRWPELLIDGLLLAHIPVAAVLAWRLHGVRCLAACASLGVASYSCGAAFMSIMSVSGRWL